VRCNPQRTVNPSQPQRRLKRAFTSAVAASAAAWPEGAATHHRRLKLGACIEAYDRAWEIGDDDLTLSLFTEEASYRVRLAPPAIIRVRPLA
jgi:hypothetical protein